MKKIKGRQRVLQLISNKVQKRTDYIKEWIDMQIDIAQVNSDRGVKTISVEQYIGGLVLMKNQFTRIRLGDDIMIDDLRTELEAEYKKHERSMAGPKPHTIDKPTLKQSTLKAYINVVKNKTFKYDSFYKWCIKNNKPENHIYSKSYLKKNIGMLIELMSPPK